MSVKHAFSSPVADGANTELVRPSDWNSSHVNTGYYWNNHAPNVSGWTSVTAISNSTRSLFLFPLDPVNDQFPMDMRASTVRMLLTMSGSTASLSNQHSFGVSLGIYRISGTDSVSTLSLVNSVGSSYTNTTLATSAAANSYSGTRWYTFHSSQWSSAPNFVNGERYFGALIMSWSSITFNSFAVVGQLNKSTFNASGTWGAASATNTTNGFGLHVGVYSATTAAFPASIHANQINKQAANAHFVPYLEFDAVASAH